MVWTISRASPPASAFSLPAGWWIGGEPALRRSPNAPLRKALREARDFGLDTLDHIISSRKDYTREFRQDYLGWHIHYHLGTDEKRGIARFMELLRKHGLGTVHEPRFAS